jgi:predicted polyphosphate/ATP-dependent NAD kinase
MLSILDRWLQTSRVMISAVEAKQGAELIWENASYAIVKLEKKK